MIKKLAKYILGGEIKNLENRLNAQISSNLALAQQNRRLEEIVNTWEKEDIVAREYSFAPKSLEQDEMETIGRYVETPILALIGKWFKSRADQNNDLLVHNLDANDEKKALYRIAVLVYDDWLMFTQKCAQMYDKAEKADKSKEKK